MTESVTFILLVSALIIFLGYIGEQFLEKPIFPPFFS